MQPLNQHGITFERSKQCPVHLDRAVDVLPAQLQQRPDAARDLFLAGHQLAEVAHAVQAELVIGHSGFHQ
jgi:hypothetical protein